jgi:catechol 2,3-dioxygenase-like lactoylglutathione lyase family enzyme
MLDHVGVPVSDFEQSKRFYATALSPLGYELIMEPSVSAAGLGRWGKPDFWISQGGEASQGMSGPHEAR